MTLTRTQIHERITDLSGQSKAAQENKRLTSAKRLEQERLSDLARQADEKADELVQRVAADIRDLIAQYASAAEELIGDGGSASVEPERVYIEGGPNAGFEPAFQSVFTQPADFQAQALQNGADRVERAFNEATT